MLSWVFSHSSQEDQSRKVRKMIKEKGSHASLFLLGVISY